MHAQQPRIAQACRRIQTGIAAMHDTPQQAEWVGICRDVMASPQPPIRVFTDFSKSIYRGLVPHRGAAARGAPVL